MTIWLNGFVRVCFSFLIFHARRNELKLFAANRYFWVMFLSWS